MNFWQAEEMNSKQINTKKGSLAKLMQTVGVPNANTAQVVYKDSKVKLVKCGTAEPATAAAHCMVSDHLNELYDGQELCDLTLHVGNAKLNIHKVVLSRCSDKYLAIFTGEPEADKKFTEIALAGEVQLVHAKQVVQFMYKRKIKLNGENIGDVLAICTQLGITQLIDKCKTYLKNCEVGCIIEYMILSARHELDDVKQHLAGRAANHVQTIFKEEAFLKLDADGLATVLNSPAAHAGGEADVFSAIARWLKVSPAERSLSAGRLLKTVRLSDVEPRLLTLIDAMPEVRSLLEVKRMLLETYKQHALVLSSAASVPSREAEESGRDDPGAKPPYGRPVLVAVGGHAISNGKITGEQKCGNFFKCEMTDGERRWDFPERMPGNRSFHCAVYARGKLYVLGGCIVSASTAEESKPRPQPLNTVLCYDAAGGTWTALEPMTERRMFFAAVEHAGCVYALGGIGEDGRALASVEFYSPRTKKWKGFQPLPLKCAGLAACVHAGTIFVVGGYLPTFNHILTMATVFYFDFETGRWDAKTPVGTKTFFSSAVEAGGTLFVIGGATRNENDAETRSTSLIRKYDDDVGEWSIVGALGAPRHCAGAIALGNVVYVIGGLSYGQVPPVSFVEAFDVGTMRPTVEHELNLPYQLSGSAFALIPER